MILVKVAQISFKSAKAKTISEVAKTKMFNIVIYRVLRLYKTYSDISTCIQFRLRHICICEHSGTYMFVECDQVIGVIFKV